MKKIVLMAAVSALTLAGCDKTAGSQNVIDTRDNAAGMLDSSQDNLEAMSDNATNAMVAKTMENATAPAQGNATADGNAATAAAAIKR